MRHVSPLPISIFALLLAACGSSNDPSTGPAPTPDPTHGPSASGPADNSGSGSSSSDSSAPPASPPTPPPPAGPDHGQPSTTFPAFPPDAPQVITSGGAVLTAPVLVTVTWPDDANADTFEQLADEMGASTYWQATVSEYGVGAAKSAAADHVRMTKSLGASIVSADIEKIVTSNVGSSTSGWPKYTDQTIYTLYLPSTTKVFDQAGDTDDMCAQGTGGYHDEVTGSNGKQIVYAVILQCPDMKVTDATLSASHEWIEAATDPHPTTAPAYAGLDPKHLAYDLAQSMQDETGDMCEFEDDQELDGETDLPFAVQRSWSNKTAAAGHAPCQPGSAGPYANVAFLDPPKDKLSFDGSSLAGDPAGTAEDMMDGFGYAIPVGTDKTIALGFFSDASAAAWKIDAAEWVVKDGMLQPGQGVLQVSLDKTSGQNGEKAYLNIKRTAKADTGASLVVVASHLGKVTRINALLVGDGAGASLAGGPGTGFVRPLHARRATRLPRFGAQRAVLKLW